MASFFFNCTRDEQPLADPNCFLRTLMAQIAGVAPLAQAKTYKPKAFSGNIRVCVPGTAFCKSGCR
jgi:hypothetical protein